MRSLSHNWRYHSNECGQSEKTSRHKWIFIPAILVAVILSPSHVAHADTWRTISRIVRAVGELGDDVPLRRLDPRFAPQRGRLVEEALKNRARRAAIDSADEIRHLDSLWRELLSPRGETILREVKSLPIPEQRIAYVMSVGAQQLKNTVPDVATRGNLIRHGGPETLLAIGRYPDLAEDALRFDLAIRNQRLLPPPGGRALGTGDFGRFFERTGDRGYSFWQKYVRPHWKLWVGGAALTAVMLAPDEFLDEVGNLTEAGLAKIARFGSKALFDAIRGAARGTIEGTGQGLKGVIEAIGTSFVTTFLTSWSGWIALICLIGAVIAFVKPLRCLLVSIFTRMFHVAVKTKAQKGEKGSLRKQG